VHRTNWLYLHNILLTPKIVSFGRQKRVSTLEEVSTDRIFALNYISPDGDFISQSIKRVLRPVFKTYVPIDVAYDDIFDLADMLIAIVLFKHTKRLISHNVASYHDRDILRLYEPILDFWKDGGRLGEEWGFVKYFYDGNTNQLVEALNEYREMTIQNHGTSSIIPDYSQTYKDALPPGFKFL